MADETRFNHVDGWSAEFKIPATVLASRLKGVKGVPFGSGTSRIVYLYSEDDVRRVCADLLKHVKPLGTL